MECLSPLPWVIIIAIRLLTLLVRAESVRGGGGRFQGFFGLGAGVCLGFIKGFL